MKKWLCLLLVLCVIPVFVYAETDLSSLSFDDLLSLQKAVEMEIMKRPEWKEVVVPSGFWTVGVDIPVGSYSVTPTSSGGYIRVRRDGRSIVSQGIRDMADAFGNLQLLDGDVVEIERGSLIFSPAMGLGF